MGSVVVRPVSSVRGKVTWGMSHFRAFWFCDALSMLWGTPAMGIRVVHLPLLWP